MMSRCRLEMNCKFRKNNRLNLAKDGMLTSQNLHPVLTHIELRLLICNACNGDGEVNCAKCTGSGSVQINCFECKGQGKIESGKSMIECDVCNGTGKVDDKCKECFGGGLVMCEACDGTGNLPDK